MDRTHLNVLYLWDADYPWDVRVEKICQSLTRHGHVVHIAARNLGRRATYELADNLHIHRLKPLDNDRLNYALSFPAFFNPRWGRLLDSIITNHDIDLVIVRDLPMAIAGIRAGRRHGLPTLFDMAEDYVAMIWNVWKHKRWSPLNLAVRNPYLAKLVERYTLPRVDHTLVVIEEAIDVVRRAGGDPDAVTIVGNTPRLDEYTSCENRVPPDLAADMDGRFTVIYTGGVKLERGLKVALDAIEQLVPTMPDLLFVVVGTGHSLDELKQVATHKRLNDHVRWTGWVDHKDMLGYIKLANVGVIPNFASDHTNRTIPNKLFDYMAFGIPVVASDAIPMKRIIDQTRCGTTFASGNAPDLARAISEVRASPVDFGGNGRTWVRREYHWGNDEQRLLRAVARTAGAETANPNLTASPLR